MSSRLANIANRLKHFNCQARSTIDKPSGSSQGRWHRQIEWRHDAAMGGKRGILALSEEFTVP